MFAVLVVVSYLVTKRGFFQKKLLVIKRHKVGHDKTREIANGILTESY